ncbi:MULTISPECIES: 50S ribosomal protein L22 [Tindallia]|uniref:Large ribosomal subunit protein uL22 n=2 Tax=Tindallia TaxID=69894 RepID=A0A1H3QX80_9FIRM|nr:MULTISPECIES: 50S ribosomal protein L22 [Tindallia]SDZ17976.1 large subunit ribosomal protein L22 [Tindallia californiensis]SFI34587.1 large subunit ribosomal protein L22 [Tindallia magadiensis]
MEARAIARHIRIAPRKAKLVADLVRGKQVNEALAILKFTPKGASPVIEKLLRSAIANAENNHSMDKDDLYISEIYANQGPTMKRFRPRAQGRATQILKRTSHIGIVLREKPDKEG